MTRPNKFAAAVARREADAATPAPADKNLTKVTVTLTRHTRNLLSKLLADLALENHVRMDVGPVGVKLYEIFLDNPDLQKEVIQRMK